MKLNQKFIGNLSSLTTSQKGNGEVTSERRAWKERKMFWGVKRKLTLDADDNGGDGEKEQ